MRTARSESVRRGGCVREAERGRHHTRAASASSCRRTSVRASFPRCLSRFSVFSCLCAYRNAHTYLPCVSVDILACCLPPHAVSCGEAPAFRPPLLGDLHENRTHLRQSPSEHLPLPYHERYRSSSRVRWRPHTDSITPLSPRAVVVYHAPCLSRSSRTCCGMRSIPPTMLWYILQLFLLLFFVPHDQKEIECFSSLFSQSLCDFLESVLCQN